jgi:hypothetical protein
LNIYRKKELNKFLTHSKILLQKKKNRCRLTDNAGGKAGQHLTCSFVPCGSLIRLKAGGRDVFAFLSLSQATKPDTWGQNYSSHHTVRQEEEGALRAAKETRRKRKNVHLLADKVKGETGKQQVNREGEDCRVWDGGETSEGWTLPVSPCRACRLSQRGFCTNSGVLQWGRRGEDMERRFQLKLQ